MLGEARPSRRTMEEAFCVEHGPAREGGIRRHEALERGVPSAKNTWQTQGKGHADAQVFATP